MHDVEKKQRKYQVLTVRRGVLLLVFLAGSAPPTLANQQGHLWVRGVHVMRANPFTRF